MQGGEGEHDSSGCATHVKIDSQFDARAISSVNVREMSRHSRLARVAVGLKHLTVVTVA